MFKKLMAVLAIAVAVLVPVQKVFAELAAAGPVNAANGFPQFYQDTNGVALEIGTDPAHTFFDPVVPGNAFSAQIGFGGEAFWYLAEALLDIPVQAGLPSGGGAIIVMAVEAAFASGDPVDGQQFPFNRLRIRVDCPVAGTYTVTHPYGVDVFTVDTPGIRAINLSVDIGGVTPDFVTALTGRVGPFLRAVNPPAPAATAGAPAGFIGSMAVTQTVTGSAFGTNFFRIAGPAGADLDAATAGIQNTVQTDQFSISGQIFNGVVNTALTVQRIVYTRGADNSGDIDVFVTSSPTATVAFTGTGLGTTTMVGDGTGKFFGRLHLAAPNAAVLPLTVSITAEDVVAGNAATTVTRDLVDIVNITAATYDVNAKTLLVQASSGDAVAPLPTLTVSGVQFGALVNGSRTFTNIIAPPSSVTVTSSKGGTDTHSVTITGVPNTGPTAANDTAVTTAGSAVIINVIANDTDIDGTITAASVVVTAQPANGTAVAAANGTVTYTPAAGFSGANTFTYTVNDNLGGTSNTATVTITVNAAAPVNSAPVANNDTATTTAGNAVAISVLTNDTDADGTISPVTLQVIAQPLNGSAVANANGTVTYTPAAGFVGTNTFTYNARDNAGALSNTATVTVTVTSANVAPVAANDTAVTAVATLVNINVVANDTDADGTVNPASIAIITQPANGTAVANANGTVTYTPNAGFTGVNSFTYTVQDNLNATSNTATVTVTVGAESIAVTQALFLQLSGSWTIRGTGSVNGAIITLRRDSVTGPIIGTATVASGAWSFSATRSPVTAVTGNVIRASSNAGATSAAFTVTVRRQ